jgi:hypothetical protein
VAQQLSVQVVSDLSGQPEAYTVRFGYEGYNYEIDLTEAEHGRLGAFLAEFIGTARRAGRSTAAKPASARRTAGSTQRDTNAIREWARSNGFQVSDRGRIPVHVQTAYHEQNR